MQRHKIQFFVFYLKHLQLVLIHQYFLPRALLNIKIKSKNSHWPADQTPCGSENKHHVLIHKAVYLQNVPKSHIVVCVLGEYVSLVIQNVALNNTGTSCKKQRQTFTD